MWAESENLKSWKVLRCTEVVLLPASNFYGLTSHLPFAILSQEEEREFSDKTIPLLFIIKLSFPPGGIKLTVSFHSCFVYPL